MFPDKDLFIELINGMHGFVIKFGSVFTTLIKSLH